MSDPVSVTRTLPCLHLDQHTPVERTDPDGRPCHCPAKWLYGCDLHGRAARTPSAARPGVPCCQTCPDYQPDQTVITPSTSSAPKPVRHLAYHLLPVTGNGTWQRNLDRLIPRLGLFNGQKVVAILTEGPDPRLPLDPPHLVRQYLSGLGIEFLEFPNNPALREVVTFLPLLDRIFKEHRSDRDVTFYAHAKGVTRPFNSSTTVHRWTDVLYHTNLDYWPLVEEHLRRFHLTGSFKKIGSGFKGSTSSWHYSGSFYWLNNSRVLDRSGWRVLDRAWWGNESWPGLHFKPHETGCLFHQAPVSSMDLYSSGYFDRVVSDLGVWKTRNRDHLQLSW